METVTGAGASGGPASADPLEDFEAYVRASERKHKRLAFLLTGDLHAAEDLLQAAYAKLYPRWDKVRAYDAPDAYLRKVMVSLRTSWWRRHRNREWTTDQLPELGGAADHAAAVVESQALLVALRELPERQRAAVVLRHWCDLSEADTAAIMNCSLGTVKSNTSKGLAQLRTRLGTALGPAEGEAS
jgi:RNA polymerase sigma-70 factor (sigma-E family)